MNSNSSIKTSEGSQSPKPKWNWRGNKLKTCFVLLLAALGIYLIAYGLVMFVDVARTQHWSTTQGTVVDLEVLDDVESAEFIVRFKYWVNGQRYQGNWGEGWNHGRAAPAVDNENSQSPSFVAQFKQKYAPGNPLEVHFDPANPADHYIDSIDNPLAGAAVLIVFGVVLLATFPMTLLERQPKQMTDNQQSTDATTPAEHPEVKSGVPSTENDTCIAHQLGATVWMPGTLVEFERPAVANSLLIKSGLIGAAVGSLGVYIWLRNATQPWEIHNLAAAIAVMGSLGFILPVLLLQGYWPAQKVTLNWRSAQLQRILANRTQTWPLRDVDCIVYLPQQNSLGLYAVVKGQTIGLVTALDFDFAKVLELPLDQLSQVADELAESLGVRIERELPSHQNASGFWRNIPRPSLRLTLAIVISIGLLVTGWLPPLFATLLLAGLVMAFVGLLIAERNTSDDQSAIPTAASAIPALNCSGAVAIIAATGAGVLMSIFPVTPVGAVLAGILIAATAFVVSCTPDMVLSQRAGVTIPMKSIACWRLAGYPVQSFVKTAKAFRLRGIRCSANNVAWLYEQERVRDTESLVAAMERRLHCGEVNFPSIGNPADTESEMRRYRSWRTHLSMLAGALAGFVVLGFFFVVTHGLEHLDNLLIVRDWQQATGTITKKIPAPGRDHSPQYYFAYSVDGQDYEAICYGPRDLAVDSQEPIRFDQSNPAVACLTKGWRADSTPFFPMFFFALSLLIWVPLPILVGHLIVGAWAAMHGEAD